MAERATPGRRPLWGAGLAVLVLGAAACSSDHAVSATSTTPVATSAVGPSTVPATTVVAPATTAVLTTAAVTTAAAAPTTVAIDAAALLQSGLDALTGSYHYISTVTVDGAAALTAEGDRVGDGSRLTLTSSDGVVSYVITADGSWVMPDGGDWQALEADPANADPIGALRAPTAVNVTSADATTTQLAVTVAPSALGLTGDTAVSLDVMITAGALSSITYATTVDGKPATVTATFAPVVDGSPVVAPI